MPSMVKGNDTKPRPEFAINNLYKYRALLFLLTTSCWTSAGRIPLPLAPPPLGSRGGRVAPPHKIHLSQHRRPCMRIDARGRALTQPVGLKWPFAYRFQPAPVPVCQTGQRGLVCLCNRQHRAHALRVASFACAGGGCRRLAATFPSRTAW